MQKKSNTLLWVLGIGVLAVGGYMWIKKRKKPAPDSTGGGETTTDLIVANSAVGKTAVAISNSTKVRSGAVVNDGVYNNIVGVFDANMPIGMVVNPAKGLDGKIWYYVKSSEKFPCPFSICGLGYNTIGVGNKEGYVRSDVVTLR